MRVHLFRPHAFFCKSWRFELLEYLHFECKTIECAIHYWYLSRKAQPNWINIYYTRLVSSGNVILTNFEPHSNRYNKIPHLKVIIHRNLFQSMVIVRTWHLNTRLWWMETNEIITSKQRQCGGPTKVHRNLSHSLNSMANVFEHWIITVFSHLAIVSP